MITVPTHKRHKQSKTSYFLYIWTSNSYCPNPYSKKDFKVVKITTAKMDINIGSQQDLRYTAARFNEKGCLQVWGGDVLSSPCRNPLSPNGTTARPTRSIYPFHVWNIIIILMQYIHVVVTLSVNSVFTIKFGCIFCIDLSGKSSIDHHRRWVLFACLLLLFWVCGCIVGFSYQKNLFFWRFKFGSLNSHYT
jgi:hypothetical protein